MTSIIYSLCGFVEETTDHVFTEMFEGDIYLSQVVEYFVDHDFGYQEDCSRPVGLS